MDRQTELDEILRAIEEMTSEDKLYLAWEYWGYLAPFGEKTDLDDLARLAFQEL